MMTQDHGTCPNCGSDYLCGKCGYSEAPIFMPSRHDFESEVAIADNVEQYLPELWKALEGCYADSTKLLIRGASVYHIPKITYIYRPIYSRKTCPKCRNKKNTHYLKKFKKLLCLECGASWPVKILRKKRVQCERRVVRIPLAVYHARGDRFGKLAGDREQRDSDIRSKHGFLAVHRIRRNTGV